MNTIFKNLLGGALGPVLSMIVQPVIKVLIDNLNTFLQTEEKSIIQNLTRDLNDLSGMIEKVINPPTK